VASFAQRLAQSYQLFGRGVGAGGQLTVLGPVEDGARGGGADGPGGHRLADQGGHLGDLSGGGLPVTPALAQHVGPQGAVGNHGGHIEDPVGPLDFVEVLGERLPVPTHPLGQGTCGPTSTSVIHRSFGREAS